MIVTRTIDNLGRLVIPSDFRKKIGVEEYSSVNVELKDKEIIITNPQNNGLTAEEKNAKAIEFIKDLKRQFDEYDEIVIKDLTELENILSKE